jgi:hypothetical protein
VGVLVATVILCAYLYISDNHTTDEYRPYVVPPHTNATILGPDALLDPLPLNKVQFKGSHNSLRLSLPLYQQLALNPPEWSCHSLELDLVQSESGDALGVSHLGSYSDRVATLEVVLRELKSYSTYHKGHHVVLVWLDMQPNSMFGTDEDFAKLFDSVLEKELGADRIFTPALMKQRAEGDWPTLGELRDKFVFVLSGRGFEEWTKARQSAYEATGNYAFVDIDQRALTQPAEDLARFKDRHFLNMPINGWIAQTSWDLVSEARRHGKITRGWAAASESRWTQALTEGINIIATEKIVGNGWAHLVPFKGRGRPFTPLPDGR